jgi:hypothetical protein
MEEYAHVDQDCTGISMVNAWSTRKNVVVAARVDSGNFTMGLSIGIRCRKDPRGFL